MDDLFLRVREMQTAAKLVGESDAFRKAIRNLPALAKADATVLISGETGTGKELVARAIHYLSPRNAYPFVAINCGSIPDSLLEEELFGHERGSFTGAHANRQGLFGQADKGTLFLDEVDALTLRAQVALLRVLQDRKYRSIGGCIEHETDARVLAATNTSLERQVEAREFRADLYYRLRVLSIHLPPLRERQADIVKLAKHFVRKHAPEGMLASELSDSAIQGLIEHHWPGNVRELENAIIRGIHFRSTDRIELEDLALDESQPQSGGGGHPPQVAPSTLLAGPMKEQKRELIESFERRYLTRLMADCHGNVTQAARFAGKERRELGKLLRKYNLDPKVFATA